MLKVVGASWLQTRISTYILVAVALVGIGLIIFGEFGRVENDGTYSATVSWRRRHGYRIDFWGQGNDLASLPMNVARAYYRTGILETGWSEVEIETSPDYPDDVQAYAAGLLEGSLTWQLIHHHWYNTVRAACAPRAKLCRRMREYLYENAENTKKIASMKRAADAYWHMVHLYFAQLQGLEDGWKFAVDRSRQELSIDHEDFLWLAMASDLPDLERANNGSDHHISSDGMIILKAIARDDSEPLLVMAHNTAAPYARMLRLMKRYKFSYHLKPEGKSSGLVPGHSISMTSYPGALSSQDESYAISGRDSELIVAGTPLIIDNHSLWTRIQGKEVIMSPARIMAANRLATDGLSWSRLLDRHNSGTSNRQWLGVEPRTRSVSVVEQIPGFTQHEDRTGEFWAAGFLGCTGAPYSPTIRELGGGGEPDDTVARAELLAALQPNLTTVQHVRDLMRGEITRFSSDEGGKKTAPPTSSSSPSSSSSTSTSSSSSTSSSVPSTTRAEEVMDDEPPAPSPQSESEQLLAYRGDLARLPRPIGVIDSKLYVVELAADESPVRMEARAGPARRSSAPPFDWSRSFPNSSHIGHPELFAFDHIVPTWVWI